MVFGHFQDQFLNIMLGMNVGTPYSYIATVNGLALGSRGIARNLAIGLLRQD